MIAKKKEIKSGRVKRNIGDSIDAKKKTPTKKTVVKKSLTASPETVIRRKTVKKKSSGSSPSPRISNTGPLLRIDTRKIKPMIDLGRVWKLVPPGKSSTLQVEVRRPDDLLVCNITLQNLVLAKMPQPIPKPEQKPVLIRKVPALPAWMVVEFPPQSFGEEVFLDATGSEVTPGTEYPEVLDDPNYPPKNTTSGTPAQAVGPLPAARMRMAGGSRIAYQMPAEQTELIFSHAGVLSAMRTWKMRLNVNAAPELKLGRTIDRAWLKDLSQNLTWNNATAGILTELDNLGGASFTTVLTQAAKRLAEQAAVALGRGETRGLKQGLQRTMNAEIARLSTRFAPLRKTDAKDAATAALAMLASISLAASKTRFDLSAEVIKHLPFLLVPLTPHEPAASVTALELPYRLILSPINPARWQHKDEPVEHQGRTELWHTRLTTAKEEYGPDKPAKVRAIWSKDSAIDDVLPFLQDPVKPYRMSLDPLDRKLLVKLMADFSQYRADRPLLPFTPLPSETKRLMLSSLGGLLDAEGSWDPLPKMVGLEQWRHLATLGRDHYVRVVYAGYLLPFGHAASLIKVTERKFEYHDKLKNKNRIAVLRQRFFIVVREKMKNYNGKGHEFKGRNFPFSAVEILTHVTPNLMAPEKPACKLQAAGGETIYTNAIPPRAAFWPMVAASANFQFELAATDLSGKRNTFAMPLLFVGVEANQAKAAEVIHAFNLSATTARRQTSINGESVCYAPLKTGAKGDPRLPTETMQFNVHPVTGVTPDQPQWYPQIETARVGIRAVQRLLGKSDAVVEVIYPQVYKQSGFTNAAGANPGELFLELSQGYALEFGEGANQSKSDRIGALVTPAMAIQGLSRIMGPASDLANVAKNQFKAADFFKNADPKILGGISLLDLLSGVKALAGDDVPKMISRELPDKIEASYQWQTTITNSATDLFIPKAGGQNTVLNLQSTVTSPIANPSATTFSSLATLTNFKVSLFGFIIIWFDSLKFDAKQGSKPDVAVEFHPTDKAIEFGGPLEFVNQLRTLIPFDGFSDPPDISVTPSGISAGFTLNLPAIQVGVFALTNASLGASFILPFDAKPMLVRFNFCERQQPFSLTVSFFGGGGFFALTVGSEGVQEIEASLEFGAGVSIDLVVASGSVEIKAGIYFHWQESGNQGTVEFAGFVRLHGELSVLGLISASLTFNLQLAFLKDQGAQKSIVWGEATLVVEIDLLIFSADVSVKCRREFANSESDPKFIDLMPDQATWSTYCNAFAEEAA